uniref:Putative S-RNase n=1 Tax=Coffea canephora TaxID=49390 RepID=H1ZS18_COFCA|nr:putative S-RNase [Coffea canephora]
MALLSYIVALIAISSAFQEQVRSEYDFIRLVQLWSNSICLHFGPIQCLRPTPLSRATLHGVWPDNWTVPLFDCAINPNNAYINLRTPRQIDRRDYYWWNYKLPSHPTINDQRWWAHEWDKHGTCSLNRFTQRGYFQLAENLMSRYDVTTILKRDIQTRYPLIAQVNQSISQFTGFRPELRCQPYRGLNMLVEMIICFDRTGTSIIDCPVLTTSCGWSVTNTIYVPGLQLIRPTQFGV